MGVTDSIVVLSWLFWVSVVRILLLEREIFVNPSAKISILHLLVDMVYLL